MLRRLIWTGLYASLAAAATLAARKGPKRPGKGRGPSPFLIIGIALAVGIVVAKMIDWSNDADAGD